MKKITKTIVTYAVLLATLTGCSSIVISNSTGTITNNNMNSNAIINQTWQEISAIGDVTARHEAGLIAIDNHIYLLGGRRINPVDVYNIETNSWINKRPSPIEIHHFQPVVFNEKIYIVGAMTGNYPNEKKLSHILIYDPQTDQWETGAEIPQERRRGGAAVSVFNNKLYISGGITQGHVTGTVTWFDEYNPATNQWRQLADMPHGRDHFQSAIIENKLYAAGGRKTSQLTGQLFSLVVNEVDVYNFNTNKWSTLTTPLPTGRAGNATIAVNHQLLVVGGESASHEVAHNEVEIFDTKTNQWLVGAKLNKGRHGSGVVLQNNKLWTISGSGNRGGGPELKSIEQLILTTN